MAGRVISQAGIEPIEAAIVRFVAGGAGLVAVMFLTRQQQWPPRQQLPGLAAMGFFGVFCYNFCFLTGLRTVPPGRASLMASLQPGIIFAFSALFLGERVTVARIAGLSVSLFGATLVLSQGDLAKLFENGLGTGDLWILGCVLSWAAYTLCGRTVLARMPSIAATTWSTLIGLAWLAIALPFTGPRTGEWNLPAITGAMFLGLLGTTLAFLWFLRGVAAIGAARASVFINLVPVFGALCSWWLLDEQFTAATLTGGALVIAGVRLLNRG